MTTKIRIILGFTLTTAILACISVIGYRGLSSASDSFLEYERLGTMDVLLSDVATAGYAAAYHLEHFASTYNPDGIKTAKEQIASAQSIVSKLLSQSRKQERIAALQSLDTALKSYAEVLNKVDGGVTSWNKAYLAAIKPSVDNLHLALTKLGETAARNDYTNVSAALNIVWYELSRLNGALMDFHSGMSSETAQVLLAEIDAIQKAIPTLDNAVTAVMSRQDREAYHVAYDSMLKALADQQANALQTIDGLGAAVTANQDALAAIADLNKGIAVDKKLCGDDTRANNSLSQNLMLGMSIGGIVLGVLFALLIVMSLIRVLTKVSAYASAVAAGDFAYDPKIREKGEIGGMVNALHHIPAVLQTVVDTSNAMANSIASGQFRARLTEGDFRGNFGDLARAINTVASSYTKILDLLPVGIMSINTDRKIRFLNSLGQQVAGGEASGEFCGDKLKTGVCTTENCFAKRTYRSRESVDGEVSVNAGGETMIFHVNTLPLNDLTGTLVGCMEILTDNTQIRNQEALMRNVATQASALADRVASASEQLAAQVEQVSRGAEMQRTRVESTASAMAEMNATVLEVARNAGQASEQSDETRNHATGGADLVNQVVSAISGVNQVAVRLQKNMEELGGQAESIGNVMNVISDIADQTNLLALNAAIEAARAGEAGRGFAVVADEVRKLAEKTMHATQEVGSSISAIQQSTKLNIAEVGNAVNGVSNATQVANSSGEALSGIVRLASATSTVVASIATAAEEQSATSEEITRAIDEINTVVAETTEGMLQSSSAVQELSRVAQELRHVLESLK